MTSSKKSPGGRGLGSALSVQYEMESQIPFPFWHLAALSLLSIFGSIKITGNGSHNATAHQERKDRYRSIDEVSEELWVEFFIEKTKSPEASLFLESRNYIFLPIRIAHPEEFDS